jgi:hypothetical protein
MCAYYVAIFCRTTLGYTPVGSTNFNIESTPLLLASGSNGSLNQGDGDKYAFFPNSSYVVSTADINRILCLKSPANGMVNSGLFRVVSVDTRRNYMYVDYRSPDIPPPETGMTWKLWENEYTFQGAIQQGGNGVNGTYQSQGAGATCSRVILQSPSPLAWQFRICIPTFYDTYWNGGAVTPHGYIGGGPLTMAPGYGGNSLGDFQPGGQHLDSPLYFNNHDQNFAGLSVAVFPPDNGQSRIYIWGDDQTGSCFIASRGVYGVGTDSFGHWGQPDNETLPLPPHNAQRLFNMGANAIYNTGNNGIYWATGGVQNVSRGGVGFGLSNQPICCIYSIYNPMFGGTFSGGGVGNVPLRSTGNVGDSPYLKATELVPVELLVGTHDNVNQNNSGPEIYVLEQRRLGEAPLIKMGQSRMGYFQTTSDGNRSWMHLNDGIYLPWQGSTIIV